MRLAFYNQMFALNGKSLFGNLLGHWAVHFQSNKKRILQRTDLKRTLEAIKQSNADIVGIAEVLDFQEDKLKRGLNDLGYGYVFFARGHRTKFRESYVKVAIASKIKCVNEELDGFPLKNEMGGGGGIVRCYFPSLKCSVINLHLASANKDVFGKQIHFLKRLVEKEKEKVILMGDFNVSYPELQWIFKDLDFVSGRLKTCSVTPILNLFFHKDIDHIFSKGLRKIKVGSVEGFSDHRLIYADLE
jgi:endonuclease/exonuclease/phosphatase (EEP) superfamily protein YafD